MFDYKRVGVEDSNLSTWDLGLMSGNWMLSLLKDMGKLEGSHWPMFLQHRIGEWGSYQLVDIGRTFAQMGDGYFPPVCPRWHLVGSGLVGFQN